jgi:hypothetical protein
VATHTPRNSGFAWAEELMGNRLPIAIGTIMNNKEEKNFMNLF